MHLKLRFVSKTLPNEPTYHTIVGHKKCIGRKYFLWISSRRKKVLISINVPFLSILWCSGLNSVNILNLTEKLKIKEAFWALKNLDLGQQKYLHTDSETPAGRTPGPHSRSARLLPCSKKDWLTEAETLDRAPDRRGLPSACRGCKSSALAGLTTRTWQVKVKWVSCSGRNSCSPSAFSFPCSRWKSTLLFSWLMKKTRHPCVLSAPTDVSDGTGCR